MKDRVQTLQDSNVFRETVVRLEAEAEKQELVRRRLNSEKEKLENNLAKEIKKGEAFNITIKKYEEDFLKLKYQEKEMQKETKILNEKYQQVLRQTEEKEERLQQQQEEVSDLRTRNDVWRNKMKVLEKAEKGNEHGSESGRKSEDSNLSEDIKCMRRDFEQFKRYISGKVDDLSDAVFNEGNSTSASFDNYIMGRDGEDASSQLGSTHHTASLTPSPESTPQKQEQSLQQPPNQLLQQQEIQHRRGEKQPQQSQKKDSTTRQLKMVPGTKLYSESVASISPTKERVETKERERSIENYRKRRNEKEDLTLIFASSMTRDISKNEFREKCRGKVRFHQFKAHKAEDIKFYMRHHLEKEQPRNVVFVCGGNDIPNKNVSMDKIREIANHLIEGGLRCKEESGVTNVIISSLMPRMHGSA